MEEQTPFLATTGAPDDDWEADHDSDQDSDHDGHQKGDKTQAGTIPPRPWCTPTWPIIRLAAAVTAAALFALLVGAAVLYRRLAADPVDGPRVDLGYATYAGTRLTAYPPSDDGGNGHNTSAAPVAVDRFLGMRYAAPPTGDLRWRAPAPPPDAAAVQPATAFGPICLSMGAQPGGGQDEDCLFVNIWAPAPADDVGSSSSSSSSSERELLPVWIFIQGGGYSANANPNIDGADVVARSGGRLVYVNFNYRVGLYGFLASERVRADGALNAGLLDQRRLLAWVREHIAAFGGDPAHVVIHGGSAGAGSVALHTLAYGGRDDGLFVGAVAESPFFPTQPTVAELEFKFDRAAAAGGCQPSVSDNTTTDTSALDCLRRLPAATLQRDVNVASPLVSSSAPSNATTGAPGFYWGPCVDGDLLEDRPSAQFRAGRFVRVPMLYGVNTDEGTLLVPNVAAEGEVAQFVVNNYPGLGAAATAPSLPSLPAASNLAASVLAAYYPQVAPVPRHDAWYPTLAQVYGELTFVCGAVNVLDAVHNATTATTAMTAEEPSGTTPPALFAYRYAMQDPDHLAAGLGTVHMMDGAAVFGPDNVHCCPPGSYYGSDPQGNPGLVPVMMDYYISFVRSLDPNTHKSPHAAAWAPWRADSSRESSRLVIYTGGNQTMETVPADQAERCRVWLGLADATEQ